MERRVRGHDPEVFGDVIRGSSVSTIRSTKLRLYASAGISRYWLITIPDSQVKDFEQPDPASSQYRTQRTVTATESLTLHFTPTDELQI